MNVHPMTLDIGWKKGTYSWLWAQPSSQSPCPDCCLPRRRILLDPPSWYCGLSWRTSCYHHTPSLLSSPSQNHCRPTESIWQCQHWNKKEECVWNSAFSSTRSGARICSQKIGKLEYEMNKKFVVWYILLQFNIWECHPWLARRFVNF